MNRLRKHSSNEVRGLVKQLVRFLTSSLCKFWKSSFLCGEMICMIVLFVFPILFLGMQEMEGNC